MASSLNKLQRAIQSDEWEIAVAAADALAKHGSTALIVLLPLLSSESGHSRNAAAIALRNIADNAAVEPLVQAIRNPITVGNRGTLVYALETHDCSNYLLFLIDLALTDTYEVQSHVLKILYDQQFRYTHADIEAAQTKLDAFAHQQDQQKGTNALITDVQTLLADLRQQAQT